MFFDKKDYEEAKGEERLEELFREAGKRGAVLALFHFDAHGKDKEAIKSFLVQFVAAVTKEPGVLYCKGVIEDAIEREGLYSSCAEVKILGQNLAVLLNVAMKYGPMAVEILMPTDIRLNAQEAQGLLLDASQASQEYAKYILEKTMKPEDYALLQEKLRRRTELGQRLRDKTGEGTREEIPEEIPKETAEEKT